MKFRQIVASSFIAIAVLASCSDDDDSSTPDVPVQVSLTDPDSSDSIVAVAEAQLLLASIEADGGTPYDADATSPFTAADNVFIPSTLGVDYRMQGNGTTSIGPAATFPMFQGWQTENGSVDTENEVYYIITESSDEDQARELGVIYSPRMAAAKGSEGVQLGNWTADGRLIFDGSVDFSGKRSLEGGEDNRAEGENLFGLLSFPPDAGGAVPGAVADAAWSSYVVLPSGVVINAQQVGNDSGRHDRVVVGDTGLAGQDLMVNENFDTDRAAVALQLLDGWQDGARYYFHFVTDTNDTGAAAIELGVLASRLSELPSFGTFPGGSLLPFSPCVNGGGVDLGNGVQGLNVATDSPNQDQDPTNTFPIDPTDTNYSPMWDAHLIEWGNDVALEDRIVLTSFDDINEARDAGILGSFRGNDASTENPGHFGLTSARAIINCPVVAQPTVVDVTRGFNLTE